MLYCGWPPDIFHKHAQILSLTTDVSAWSTFANDVSFNSEQQRSLDVRVTGAGTETHRRAKPLVKPSKNRLYSKQGRWSTAHSLSLFPPLTRGLEHSWQQVRLIYKALYKSNISIPTLENRPENTPVNPKDAVNRNIKRDSAAYLCS